MKRVRLLAAMLFCAASVLLGSAPANAVSYAEIEGTGSTWSQVIVNQWIADVSSSGMQVVYTGGGSSKGRKDFAQSSTDFAISEIPYQGTDEQGNADSSSRPYAYLPIVAGGTSFTYQLKVGGQLVKDLRLSGTTLAKIFTNQITNWNDPAITADNNGRAFPSLPITPVVRSDGSGTTAQFTAWMDSQFPDIWRPFNGGRSGLTSYYPIKGRAIGQAGSDQVMNTISGFAGNGTIGYVEYSYPLNKNYPVVKVLNKAGYYVEPTQYNTAVALTKAQINMDPTSQLYLTQILDQVYSNPDPRAYPISSYSYMIIPTSATDSRMTTAKRQTLADFLYYSLCTGQTKAGAYGYSPLPLNLVQAGFDQVSKLGQADPAVDLTNRDVKSCNNPTFDGKNLSKNKLAEIAPQPASCDKQGAGPCGTDTGTGKPSTDDPSAAPSAGPSAGATTTTTDTGGGGTVASAPPVVDPATGVEVSAAPVVDPATGTQASTDTGTTTTAQQPSFAAPTELASARPADTKTFGWVAALLLLALVLVPGLMVNSFRRRGARGGAR